MFDLKEIHEVAKMLEDKKGIKKEKIFEAIGDALAAAYKKEHGERGQIVKADFHGETGEVEYYQVKIVLDEESIISDEKAQEMSKAEYLDAKDAGKSRFIPERNIMLDVAKLIKNDAKVGDEITFPLELKGNFSRVSTQSAKQAILRAIRDAERQHLSEKFGHLENTIVKGKVLKNDSGTVSVQLDGLEAILPYAEQIKKENYKTGDNIKAVLISAEPEGRDISLKLSRTHPELLKQLFINEVPEIRDGEIEIKSVSRDPGFRAKVAVVSYEDDIDPIGSLVGQGGSRVNAISNELSGERIDIVEWSERIEDFVEDALAPAEVVSVRMVEEDVAEVVVSDDQFSLAIGRGGQNVRLAAKLVGLKIDIKKEEKEEEEAVNTEEEEVQNI